MKSLIGVLIFVLQTVAWASEFSCPVSEQVAKYTCSGTVKVKSLVELNAYKSDLGVVAKKPKVAKNLQIDFNLKLTSDLAISTPCSIKFSKNTIIDSTANICLHGHKGIIIEEDFKFKGKNLQLESAEEVLIDKDSVIKAADIKLLSIGRGNTSKAGVREKAQIDAENLLIESYDKGFVGRNSKINLTDTLGIYTLGDDEASVREGSRVEALKIEISSKEETKIARDTTLVADDVILNGKKCNINKSAVILATERLGNCFLTSLTKAKFSIDVNKGNIPFVVNFNGSTISGSKGFVWSFGDGEVLQSTNSTVSHTYTKSGIFTATLKYATKDKFKGLKSAGSVQIDSRPEVTPPSLSPVADIECFSNNLLVYCNGFYSYDPQGYPLTYSFDYGDSFVDTNANGISSHWYSSSGFYNISLKVTNSVGESNVMTINIQALQGLNNNPPDLNYRCNTSGPYILKCSATGEDFDGYVAAYTFNWGDGTSETHATGAEVTHIYSNGGPTNVTISAIDNDGAISSRIATYMIEANHPPIAFISCLSPGPQKVRCVSQSYDPDAGDMITEYKWDLGNGESVKSLMPVLEYTYPEAGTYIIGLEVKDSSGESASISKSVTLLENQAPVISSMRCALNSGGAYQCNSSSDDVDGQVVSQVWTIEGVDIPGESILYDFTNGGDKIITYTVKDNLGKSTVKTITVHVDKPEGVLACTKISNYKVKCDASNSTTASSGAKLKYVMNFADDYLTYNPIGEYEFQSAGDKIIKLRIEDDLGDKVTKEVIIKILPAYTSPIAFFYEDVELGRVVNFDASESLLQDRTVVKYEWDFGDNDKETTTIPKVTHTFQDNIYYDVKLKVTDASGAQHSFQKKVFIFDPQVNDPAEQGKRNLMGTDSDNDGIRDDVQRWIQLEAKDNLTSRKYFRAIAFLYEENFKNLNNLGNIVNNFSKLNKLEQCLSLVEVDQVKRDQKKSIFRIAYGNTDVRFDALNKIDSSFAGQEIHDDMNEVDLKTFCEALP